MCSVRQDVRLIFVWCPTDFFCWQNWPTLSFICHLL